MSLDALLGRLDDPKPNGRDRWRCACPVCGGRNRSTLSVGLGDTGAVLLKCWKEGCSPQQIAHAVGLELQDLFPPREQHGGPAKRRALVTAGQALGLLHDQAQLVALCAANIANGVGLNDADRQRCLEAAGRIAYLCDEVRA